MNTIDSITLEVSDPAAAETFYSRAFGIGDRLRLRATDAETSGFRGYTLSLIVAQPADARLLLDDAIAAAAEELMPGGAIDAIAAGATVLKPAAKSLWGFGGTVQAPDGSVWNIATSAKKDAAPPSRAFQEFVLLLGVEKVSISKQFYVDRGFAVKKSFGSYVDFDTPAGSIGLGLYKRAALAESAGVDADGSGSHRLVIGGSLGDVTDPDGFTWSSPA